MRIAVPLASSGWFGTRSVLVRLGLAILGVFFSVLTSHSAPAEQDVKNVLVLHNWANLPHPDGIHRAGSYSGTDQLLYGVDGKPTVLGQLDRPSV